MKDFLLLFGFVAVSALFAWIIIKYPPKSLQRDALRGTKKSREGNATTQTDAKLELPRKDFSTKDSIDYSIAQDTDGNRVISMSEDDVETLKANILGRHTPESQTKHFDEIEHLLKKRDWLKDEFSKTYDQSEEIREKYNALEITEKLAITTVKRSFENEFAEMLNRLSVLMDIRDVDLKASERSVAILKSEVALLEIVRDYWWKLNSLYLCFELEDWITQANEIRQRFYVALEEHLDTWKCREEMETAWKKYQDNKAE